MLGLGLSVTQLAVRGLRISDLAAAIRALFAANEPGVWYDPSDMSTMFQDAAGTTPVTAVEQPVGLMLDKSKNGVGTNGAKRVNLLTKTESLTDAAWTKTAGVTVTDNAAIAPDGTMTASTIAFGAWSREIAQSFSATTATTIPTFYVKGTAGQVLNFGAAGIDRSITLTGGWDIATSTLPSGATKFYIGNYSGGANALNISIWHPDLRLASEASTLPTYQKITDTWYNTLPGNHATQTTSTSRPVLSARVNLLTKTEQFNDAAWTKTNVTVTANAVNAPDGTLTADTITATSTRPIIGETISSLPAKQYKYSVSVKKGLSFTLSLDNGLNAGIGATFNGVTGAYVTSNVLGSGYILNSYSCITHPNDSDYWLASINVTPQSASNTSLSVWINRNELSGYPSSGIANIGDTLTIWGSSLVPADQASLPYQRVNTATDYDTAGFPHYLRFDGVDDFLVTNSINFTATDKMFVSAGVRKLSDADGIISELSQNLNSYNGSFYFASQPLGKFGSSSRGAATAIFSQEGYSSGYYAPVTAVLSALHDISGDLSILRVNGIAGINGTGDKGAGNFGNYPLYIGARAGSSLWFNGRIYSLVVRGAQSTDQQIIDAETYINSKTKAYA